MMKITFTEQQIEQLLQVLQDKLDDTFREEELEIVPRLMRKLQAAQNYSIASTSKAKYLLFARMDRENKQHEETVEAVLKMKADLDKEMREHE